MRDCRDSDSDCPLLALFVTRVAKLGPRTLARGSVNSENHRMDFITFGVTGLALIVYVVAGIILLYAVVRLLLAAARFLERRS